MIYYFSAMMNRNLSNVCLLVPDVTDFMLETRQRQYISLKGEKQSKWFICESYSVCNWDVLYTKDYYTTHCVQVLQLLSRAKKNDLIQHDQVTQQLEFFGFYEIQQWSRRLLFWLSFQRIEILKKILSKFLFVWSLAKTIKILFSLS